MVTVKRYNAIDMEELEGLKGYLDSKEKDTLPYHTVGFAEVMQEVFNYKNSSLVAFNKDKKVAGYLPQWIKGHAIESVPWRDKGGPVYDSEDVIIAFIEETKAIIKRGKLKGFVWKGFQTKELQNYNYFINVGIDLTLCTNESYWEKISFKVRNKIRNAEKNGLLFKEEANNNEDAVLSFYRLFTVNRKRLGVPVYPIKLFKSLFKHIPSNQIKLFSVYKNDIAVSSMIMLHNRYTAIDAYSASNSEGLKLKANDFLVYKVLYYCMQNKIRYFDFGADSPLQKSLIDYKLKWLGEQKELTTSFYGNIREEDHNKPRYNLIREMIKKMPMPLYLTFSKTVVR